MFFAIFMPLFGGGMIMTMLKVKDIIEGLTDVAPLNFQESYDNAGLQVGDEQAQVDKALVCVDVTEAVVDEAILKGCNLIVSHHPLLFRALKHVTPKTPVERMVIKALQKNIAIVSMHTNLDNSVMGVNRILAEKIGLVDLCILQPMEGRMRKLVVFCPVAAADNVRKAMFDAGAGCIGNYDSCSFNVNGRGTFKAGETAHPYVGEIGSLHVENEIRIETIVPDHLLKRVVQAMLKAHPYEEVAYDVFRLENKNPLAGSGMMGALKNPMPEEEFMQHLCQVLGAPCLRHSAFTGKMIRKVALCGGAGSFLLKEALQLRADAFVTADLKYHDFFEADGSLLMVDGGHFETEQFTKELISALIRKKNPTFAAVICETITNPVHYFVKNS